MRFSLLCLCWICSLSISAQTSPYFPPITGASWDTIAPSSLNWCPDKVDSLRSYLSQEQTKAFLVLKGGKIVLEEYFDNFTADSLWVWNSAGKTLTASLVGIAQQEGLLSINDRSSDYLGQGWTNMPLAKENLITIWHQLTMTTGLDVSGDLFCTIDTCLQYAADAGTQWYYHNAPYSLLRDVLEQASNTNLNIYTQQKIKNPIGMSSGLWLSLGFNNIFVSRARDMARFGWLIANEGYWDGTAVLQDSAYVRDMLHPSQQLNESYGYLWWLNGQNSFMAPGSSFVFPGMLSPSAPADVKLAAGKDAQLISFSEMEDLLFVRMGNSNSNALVSFDIHEGIWLRLMDIECPTTTTSTASVQSIQLFPNPVQNTLHLHLPEHAQRIEIYDIWGRQQGSFTASRTLDVSSLAAGVYYLQVWGEGELYQLQSFVKR